MVDAVIASWSDWWDTLTPTFVFLLALPFVVAAAGLVGDAVRRRWRRR